MRVLVVLCHPAPGSFASHVRDVALDTLRGDDLRSLDIYRSDRNEDSALLRWAEAVVLVYPTWWGSFPAPLTAWLEAGLDREDWRRIHRVAAVTTHGSSHLVNLLTGGVGRRIVRRGLIGQMAVGARGLFLALYSMDRATVHDREAFLQRVRARLPAALR